MNLPLSFFLKRNINPTISVEPQEHRLGEVLQGRNPNFILSYLFCYFGGSGFHNPNYLENQKTRISKFLAPMIQNS